MNSLPKCEATKAGLTPPEDPAEFEAWRKSLDPDAMGFDGAEFDGGEELGTDH
ncbi:hypothetical protein [uncultured Flavonifractor sp.]|jgi:hypothetical protein|uniref:hypothetical protein n=1 Tax=uncultured Flavonifractor sp. TaxID=1193534 RepID=UPI002632AFC1|nr:hypothetical protein [uncultured Flavonifractor sp.]